MTLRSGTRFGLQNASPNQTKINKRRYEKTIIFWMHPGSHFYQFGGRKRYQKLFRIEPKTSLEAEKVDFVRYAESCGFHQSGWGVGPSENLNNQQKSLKKHRKNWPPEKKRPESDFDLIWVDLGIPRGSQDRQTNASKKGSKTDPQKSSQTSGSVK